MTTIRSAASRARWLCYFHCHPSLQTYVRNAIIVMQTLVCEGRDIMANNKMEEILEYLGKRTEPSAPTVSEVAEAIGMSVEPTHHMLIVLKERGYIKSS